MILLLIFLPLNFKESFFNYFNLREKVAGAFRRPLVLIVSTVLCNITEQYSITHREIMFWDEEVLGSGMH